MIYPAIKRTAVIACMLLFCTLAQAQPGLIDNDYYASEGGGYYVQDIVPLPDSGFIVGGAFTYMGGEAAVRIAKLRKDGTPDPGFQTGTGFNEIVYSVALQADGKILVGGAFTSFNGTSCNRIARLNSNGSLDTTFSTGAGFNNIVRDIIVQPDGKIMAVGHFSAYRGSTIYKSARIKADGHMDSTYTSPVNTINTYSVFRQANNKYLLAGAYSASFKNVRRVHADGSTDTTFNNSGSGPNGDVWKIAVLSTGKICIAGSFAQYNGSGAVRALVLDTNGTVYGGFSAGTGPNATAYGFYEQPDGKLIFHGDFTSYNGTSISRIVRTSSAGVRDTTFKPGSGFDDLCLAVAPTADGHLLAGGQFLLYNTYARIGLAKLDGAGSLKQDMFYHSGFNADVRAIAKQSDGSTIVGGSFTRFNDRAVGYIVRLDPQGNLDTTFNVSGAGANNIVSAIYVLPDDKILIGGSFTQFNGTSRTRLALLDANGSLNTSFTMTASNTVRNIKSGAGGKIYVMGLFTALGGQTRKGIARLNSDLSLDNAVAPGTQASASILDVAEQSDGKLLLAGTFTTYGDSAAAAIVRIDTLGNRDTSFHTGSGFYMSPGSGTASLSSLNLQPDGKIVAGGFFVQYNGVTKNGMVRLLANGTLDTSYAATFNAGLVSVNSLKPYGSSLLAGGGFTTANGTSHSGFACFDSTGALDPKFESGSGVGGLFGALIYAVCSDQYTGRVLLGGKFTAMHNVNRSYYAGVTAEFLDAAIDSVKIDTLLCTGGTTNVTFKKLKGFSTGNVFSIQMSNSSGSFASPVVIGSKTASGSGWESVPVTIPSGATLGMGYRMRIISTKAIYTSAHSDTLKIDSLTQVVAPLFQWAYSDSAYLFILDSIQGDNIEWSRSSSFDTGYYIGSGDSIMISVPSEQLDTIWMRSYLPSSGCTGSIAYTTLATIPHTIQPINFREEKLKQILHVGSNLKFTVPGYSYQQADSIDFKYRVKTAGAEVISTNPVGYSADGYYEINGLGSLATGTEHELEFTIHNGNRYSITIIRE